MKAYVVSVLGTAIAFGAAGFIYIGIRLERWLKEREAHRAVERIMETIERNEGLRDDPFAGAIFTDGEREERVEWAGPRINARVRGGLS